MCVVGQIPQSKQKIRSLEIFEAVEWESGTWKNKARENGTSLIRAKICC